MGIVLARIDNRLLHGIVATQWAGRSGAQRIMIIDDTVANNELTKASMKLARPTGTVSYTHLRPGRSFPATDRPPVTQAGSTSRIA